MGRGELINAAGQVESIDISSTTIGTYSYNANNQRTKKVTGAGTVHYVYGMGGLLYGEYDGSGALIREYIYLNGEPIAQIDNVSSSDVLTYLHTDHLGTPRVASNTSGASVWSWDSDAFGNGAPTGSQTVNLRFAGQYYDDESDLHYNWNRYYDPTTGRYISSDPIGLNGGLNTFAYVGANPVMFIDPEGLTSVDTAGDILDDAAKGVSKGGIAGGILGGAKGATKNIPVLGSIFQCLDYITDEIFGIGTANAPADESEKGEEGEKKGKKASDSGKNEKHVNQNKKNKNKEKYDKEKAVLDDMKRKPNKSRADKEAIKKQERLVKKLRQEAERKGENHSQKGKR
ncbi:MAG: RHS repeat-associated core domain-containing protein [Alphaproteobacteria bacterium]